MKYRHYRTTLNKEDFLSKLNTYFFYSFFGAAVKGNVDSNKSGILIWALIKKFFIIFVDDTHFKVRSHIHIVDIIWIILSILCFSSSLFLYVQGSENIIAGSITLICGILFCGIALLLNVLAWRKINKLLKKDFASSKDFIQ